MKTRSFINGLTLLALLLSLIGSAVTVTPAQADGRCYVNDNAGGANNGTSWTDAYTSLQSAIADTCTEIWVAAGTYKPHASDREISFNLENGTAIYGGFAGTETLLSQRVIGTHNSILSGDLGGNDIGFTNNSENSYHVVVGATGAILDGFTVSGGNANGSSPHNSGGGMFIDSSNPSIANVTFMYNAATQFGGGIYSSFSSPTITNVTITTNSVPFIGGGIYTNYGTVTLTNVTISGNTGTGLSIYSGDNGGHVLTNVIIANNTTYDCSYPGGLGFINSSASFNNIIEVNGFMSECGLTNGVNGNIIGSDPNLGTLTGSPAYFPLNAGSIAINAGTNTGCPATSQNGVARPHDVTCDIGSFEKPLTFADVSFNYFAWQYIESIYLEGVTGGCGNNPLRYCPSGTVTRAQMAVFLMKAINGSSYSPSPATGTVFNDVPANGFAAAFIEAFATAGITGGCGGGNFCPNGLVTRAQMAVFLMKAKNISNPSYSPPDATGTMFNDVPADAFAAAWIEALATEGITGGCGGGNYCPNNTVTRAQMAVFLQKTFNLPLP